MQTDQKQETYVCEVCGATSNKPKQCCGQPMKKKSASDSNCDCK